ncbi:MAG TPA: hypothetical protein PLS20_14290, partial [Ruminococcus flavefaciens]|nr:hypothetical protein [Ruminococcus flavefaciens]
SNEDTDLNYRVVVRNRDQAFNTNLLAGHTWQNIDGYYTTLNGTDANCFSMDVNCTGENNWDTQVYISDLPIFEGYYYKLSFWVGQTDLDDPTFFCALQQNHEPYGHVGDFDEVDPDDGYYECVIAGSMNSGLTKLFFDGFVIGHYDFSAIELERITEEDYNEWLASTGQGGSEENIEDGDEDDSLIFDVTSWSDYNGGWSADYEATNTYTGDSVSIELPAAYSGYFGAKYSGIDLEAGTYQLTFDLAVIGMADVEICIRDAEGNAVFEAMGDSGYDPVTNTFTFTIDEAIEGGSLTMVFYTDSSMEGSIGASNVSVTNISLVELIPVGEDGGLFD